MSSISMPPSIKSNADLIDRLGRKSDVEPTPEQQIEETISFVYGNLPASSKITRAQVAARITRSHIAA